MGLLEDTRHRLGSVLSKVDDLRAAEYPYSTSTDLLDAVSHTLKEQQSALDKITDQNSPEVIANACGITLEYIYIYLPVLGFVLRSRNVNNPLEMYWPLHRLANGLVPGIKLLISSEWELFPFTYMALPHLDDFVLIGFPASESNNALLTPLAGHELGHSMWLEHELDSEYASRIEDEIVIAIKGRWDRFAQLFRIEQGQKADDLTTDMFLRQRWRPAYDWALRQCEEVFCDMVGLRSFGEAYIEAFAYLVSPGVPGERAGWYPKMDKRLEFIVGAAGDFGLSVTTDLAARFGEERAAFEEIEGFLVELSDAVSERLATDLRARAKAYVDSCGLFAGDNDARTRILKAFRQLTPITRRETLTDLLNAGWAAAKDPNIWDKYPHVIDRRAQVLNELLLKSAEVIETYERVPGLG